MGSRHIEIDDRIPSNEAILERAKSLCNEACLTVSLQHRRLLTREPEDEVFTFRWWADLQFLIVALRRLRRSADLAARVPCVSDHVRRAIQEFDEALPSLAKMRNVGEHIDEYAVDYRKRRHDDVSRRYLQSGTWDGKVYRWIGELDIDVALDAAQKLFHAVRMAVAEFAVSLKE